MFVKMAKKRGGGVKKKTSQFLKKCFKKAVEAFKVWASKGITASQKKFKMRFGG